jgi:hypothetical protein
VDLRGHRDAAIETLGAVPGSSRISVCEFSFGRSSEAAFSVEGLAPASPGVAARGAPFGSSGRPSTTTTQATSARTTTAVTMYSTCGSGISEPSYGTWACRFLKKKATQPEGSKP